MFLRFRVWTIMGAAAAFAAAAPVSAVAGEADGGNTAGNLSLFDAGTMAALTHYRTELASKPTGIYENGAWVYAQARVPCGRSVKAREVAQEAALLALDNEFLRWAIDLAMEKRGGDAPVALTPGARLVRDCLRRENAAWEFGHIDVPPVPTQEIVDEPDGNEYVAAWMARKEAVLGALPGNLGAPWDSRRWVEAARDLVRLKQKANPVAFAATLEAVDVVGARTVEIKGEFPALDREDFASAAAEFVSANVSEDADGGAESREWGAALGRYVAESAAAAAVRERGLALLSAPVRENIVLSDPVVQVTTNESCEVTTNLLEGAAVSASRTVRDLPAGETLRGGMPFASKVFVERTDEPLYVVTTRRTIVIHETTTAQAGRVRVSETGRPQFERLFLAAGILPNAPSPQTDRGAAAVSLVYKGGVSSARKEAALMDALGENPGDKTLWNFLGRIYQDRQDWIGAAICFRNALRLDPEFDYALTNLADCHKSLGNVQLAVGTAVLAKGLAANEWCEKRATAILETPLEGFGGK